MGIRVGEEDSLAEQRGDLVVARHLAALVPGQRQQLAPVDAAQGCGQPGDQLLGAMPARQMHQAQ
jgi:hypothetical protein